MDRARIYDVWAGADHPWELWVKPALFAQLDDEVPAGGSASGYRGEEPPWSDVDVGWVPDVDERAVLVVDLPGAAALELGLALMGRGYRPIVAINASTGPSEAVEMEPVLAALRMGARFPRRFPQGPGAPPAFLLDARRMRPTRPLVPGVFDNRWMIFRQDLPSAALLRRQGLLSVVAVVEGEALADDLRHVLFAWQEGGLPIAVYDGAKLAATKVEAPSWLRRMLGRPAGAGDLRRNEDGSFGRRVPELPVREPSLG